MTVKEKSRRPADIFSRIYHKFDFVFNRSFFIENLRNKIANDGVKFFLCCIKLDIENPIIRINTAFKGCSSLEKISVLPRIYHN